MMTATAPHDLMSLQGFKVAIDYLNLRADLEKG
jgi:hypothetical protein